MDHWRPSADVYEIIEGDRGCAAGGVASEAMLDEIAMDAVVTRGLHGLGRAHFCHDRATDDLGLGDGGGLFLDGGIEGVGEIVLCCRAFPFWGVVDHSGVDDFIFWGDDDDGGHTIDPETLGDFRAWVGDPLEFVVALIEDLLDSVAGFAFLGEICLELDALLPVFFNEGVDSLGVLLGDGAFNAPEHDDPDGALFLGKAVLNREAVEGEDCEYETEQDSS